MDSKEEQDTSCRSQVVKRNMDNWLVRKVEQLKDQRKHSTGDVNKVSDSRPKIQRIPQHMAERVDFIKYYEPQIISIGPFHLQKLLQGKPYKDTWTAMYLEHTNPNLQELYERIYNTDSEQLQELVRGYRNAGLDMRVALAYDIPFNGYTDIMEEFLLWMLVLDGCSVLELLEKSDNSVDPVKELEISMHKLIRVHQDLLIMDNQIPLQVLRLLCNDDRRLEQCLYNFLQVHGIETENQEVKVGVDGDDEEHQEDPLHLLDYLRRALLMRDLDIIHKDIKIKRRSLHLRKYRIGTIRELKAAGIQVRRHSNINYLYPSFNHGILHLPELTVDGSTAHIFLNLIALEMCPDFCNDFEISSFMVFMSSLIDQPEDVKEVRLAGILINELANDNEVADLFNKMDSFLVPETPLFAQVSDQIHLHFKSKRGKIKILSWMGEAYNTFLRSPWTIIALLAAALGLVLTFIQTWLAMHPNKCSQ